MELRSSGFGEANREAMPTVVLQASLGFPISSTSIAFCSSKDASTEGSFAAIVCVTDC